MKLEDKFIEVLTQAREPYIMYLQSPKDGYIKLEYRKKWNDGLSTTSNIRIINPKLGISTAPTSWTHLLKSLEVNGINEDEFNRVLDRRIDMQIVHNYRLMADMKKAFGEQYVDNVIETKAKRSFADDISDLFKSLIKKTKPEVKPTLTIIKGGSDS